MNILHLDDETWDSGLTDYCLTLAQAQGRQGHNTLVWAPPESFALEKARSLGVPAAPCGRWWAQPFRLRKELEAFRPDIINAHTGSSHSMAAVLSAGLSPRPALMRTRADARPLKKRPLGGLLWSRTAGFIAANSLILEDFRREVKLPGINSAVIRQGIEGVGAKENNFYEKGRAVIGMAARLDPVKGHATALEAAALVLKQFPGAAFRFAGADKNVTADSLVEKARALGIETSVTFEGYVPDIGVFMRSCHIGIVPSLGSEAISRAALEWLSAGVPVAASDAGCLPEVIRSGETGFVVPRGNPAALAEALCKLLGEPALGEKAGKAGLEFFKTKFSVGVFAADTFKFYEQALSGLSPG